jgi:hypothetical protein
MVGASTSANDFFPNREMSASQPATAPGTVTEWIPLDGIHCSPLLRKNSGVSPLGPTQRH